MLHTDKLPLRHIVEDKRREEKIREVDHSWWLNTGNRLKKVWVLKHGLTGNDLKDFCVIIEFVADFNFPM